jgi:hypothetical protein
MINFGHVDLDHEYDVTWWECPDCEARYETNEKRCRDCEDTYGIFVQLKERHLRCDECSRIRCACDSWESHD